LFEQNYQSAMRLTLRENKYANLTVCEQKGIYLLI